MAARKRGLPLNVLSPLKASIYWSGISSTSRDSNKASSPGSPRRWRQHLLRRSVQAASTYYAVRTIA